MVTSRFRWSILAVCLVCLLALVESRPGWAERPNKAARQIIVPLEDRFTPFAITIRVGQTVEWVNNDADDHTVVSNDAFNTAGHRGVNVILPANGGTFHLTFIGEVARCAFFLKCGHVELNLFEVLNVSILRFLRSFDCFDAALQCFADHIGRVIALVAELQRDRRIQTTLYVTDEELIRKTMRHGAVLGLRTITPVIVDRQVIATFNFANAPTTLEIAADFKAAGEDQAIDFVFLTIDHKALRSDALQALGIGHVQQADIGLIECGVVDIAR